MPLISVIMTSYNHRKYISEAIESVLGQTFGDIELIVVDDASQDDSQDIIRKFQRTDPRIRPVFHKQNLGISRTTNHGFASAKGEYIAYIQSDDVWMTHKLQEQLRVLNRDRSLIVWSDGLIIDGEGKENGELFTERYRAAKRKKSGDIFLELARGNFICVQSLIFKAEYTRDIRFDPRCRYANDYKFMIDLSSRHPFHFIPDPLIKYRIHGKNTILKNRHIWERDVFFMNKYLLQNYARCLPRNLRALFYFRLGRTLHKRNRDNLADKFLLKALRTDPCYRYCRKYIQRLLYKGHY